MKRETSQSRLTRWLIIISLALLIVSFVMFLADRKLKTIPRCVGLPCYDDSDCGSHCFCDLDPPSTEGSCVMRN